MNNILIGNYNNYFNRIVKIENSVNDYITAFGETSKRVDLINFNPSDGVNTELILGEGDYHGTPDYLIVFDETTEDSEITQTIISRWFIMDMDRTRGGQYKLSLRRDVIADNLNEVLTASTYIEKGYVNAGSPLVFNKEGMLFNQIKKSEETLKDKSRCAWLVGYISKDATASDVIINYDPASQNYENVSAANIDGWFQSFGITPGQVFLAEPYDISYRTDWQAGPDISYKYAGKTYIYDTGSYGTEENYFSFDNYALQASYDAKIAEVSTKLLKAYNTYGLSTFKSALIKLVGAHSSSEVTSIKYYNGKIIKTQDGKYYKITVTAAPSVHSVSNESLLAGNDLYNLMTSAAQTSGAFVSGHTTPNNNSFKYSFKCSQYIVSYQEDYSYEVKSNISATRNKTKDAIYDIIALPYPLSDEVLNIHNASNNINFDVNQSVSIASITSIATALGGGGSVSKIYDIQLLPYCPIQTLIDTTKGGMLIDESKVGKEFDYITDKSTNKNIGIIFYVPESAFTFDIDKSIYWDEYKIISGFTDIEVLPYPYTAIKPNVEYVIPTLVNPDLGTTQGTIKTKDENSRYTNTITVNKIDRKTGDVIDTVNVNSITLTYNSSTNNNILSCGVVVYSGDTPGWFTPHSSDGREWLFSSLTYEEADYYIEFIINSNYFDVQNMNEVFGKVCKIPVYSNEVDGSYAMKIDNECNSYRLVSPNYQGEFEFSPVKNGGVDRFNVDCTYKPFNPYIHVNPDFGGLYGDDFNDSRGLICQGDYTVGMISDAFTNYELQNKNYQAIFNRQIQNMDVSNEIARQEQGFKAITGTLQGATSGAMAGAISSGGGYGAIAGAVVGGIASGIGGIIDSRNLEKQLRENKNYAVDMYNFNLQNIKALPYTITRCTALTYNNKLFPFIEKYSCTDEEKEAFINKLNYDGMTVNVIGQIKNYTDREGRMIKGQIIRLPNLKDDNHMAKEIYNEILKGVYI